MEFTEFDEGGDRRVLFLLGWGNRTRHENVQWLVEALLDAGWVVDVGQLHDHPSDFEREYLDPAQQRHDETEPDRLLSHSTGGLIAAHMESDAPRVYLSPWWGMADDPTLLQGLLVSLPIARPIIPLPDDDEAIGDLATDEQLADGPDWGSPAFFSTMLDAQKRLPPLREESVVFCSLEDRVVGIDAIGARTPAERTVVYGGGHELFSSSSRETSIDWLLATLEAGPDALSVPSLSDRSERSA